MEQDRSEEADSVRSFYAPDHHDSLTEAVLDAIEECKGDGLMRSDFDLYEDIDPDALDSLFRHDARPRTTVSIRTDGIEVELWGDEGVEIRVTDRQHRIVG